MLIEWSITKKRGNLRPVLQYRVRLEDHEKELAIPEVQVASTIPCPEQPSQKHCYPGQMERAEGFVPERFHSLESPSHQGYPQLHTLVLPWREGNSYPEVEESFGLLRDAMEREIARASASAPMDEQGQVRTSSKTKAAVAPALAAARLLRLAQMAAVPQA